MFSNGPVPRFCFSFELFFKTVQLFLFSCIPVANEVSPVLVLIIGEQVDLTQFAHNVFLSELEKRCRCFLYVFVVFVGMEENATLCARSGAQVSARTSWHFTSRSNFFRNFLYLLEPIRCFGEVGNTMHHMVQAPVTFPLYVGFFCCLFWALFWVVELASRGRLL